MTLFGLMKAVRKDDFKEGDPVWYRNYFPSSYGYEASIPALFVRRPSPRRVTILVQMKDGTRRQIHVAPKNVRPRDPATGIDPFTQG